MFGKRAKLSFEEICLLDVLKSHKGTEFTTDELAHYLNVTPQRVQQLMSDLQSKDYAVCSEPVRNVHYHANNKWWHFLIGALILVTPLLASIEFV